MAASIPFSDSGREPSLEYGAGFSGKDCWKFLGKGYGRVGSIFQCISGDPRKRNAPGCDGLADKNR